MGLFQTDRPPSWQACLACGDEFLEVSVSVRCDCGGLLEVRHRGPEQAASLLLDRFHQRRTAPYGVDRSGVWRFRELILPAVAEADIVTHPEGHTPLLRRGAVADWAGVDELQVKHEGHNPTGSFKDRGMTVGITQALRVGARAVACASTGNTAASLAAYAAQAGLTALVLVPAGRVALGKLAQTIAYGARILAVRGDFDACLELLEQQAGRHRIYLLNSVNPFRIEGQKAIVFELLEQYGWDPPDWIALPAGNLGNTAAFGKALREAREWGLIDRVPRLAAIQAAGAAPFAAGFAAGFTSRRTVRAETVATAIRIGNPASWDRAVTAIRETNGVVSTVTDEEILEAKRVIDRSGVGCEPASAASLAGVRRLMSDGIIGPGERVAAVLTGHLLKDPEILVRDAGRAVTEIEPDPEALAAALND